MAGAELRRFDIVGVDERLDRWRGDGDWSRLVNRGEVGVDAGFVSGRIWKEK